MDDSPIELIKSKDAEIKVGNRVFVKSLGSFAKIVSVKPNKKEAEVLLGNIKTVVKFNDLYNSEKDAEKQENIKVYKSGVSGALKPEINVLGKTSLEAEDEVGAFITQAVMSGMDEIKIVHGVGEGILLKTIREYLKKDKRVLEFRRGKYGEGENGVTIVKLK